MADKEQEGVEKGMDTPDAGAPESAAKTTETGSGERIEEGKPEQEASDAEKTENRAKTTAIESEEGAADNKPDQQKTHPEELEDSEDAAIQPEAGDGNDGSKAGREEKTSLFQIFIGIAQITASLAAVVATVLSLFTLLEVRTERENAYRPEIVVEPKMFEGGEDSKRQLVDGKTYMFIDCEQSDPMSWFAGTTPGFHHDHPSGKRSWTTWTEDNTSTRQNLLYLEVPYLSLRNIGQGTAKDVQVTFLADSVIEEFVELNHNSEIFNENSADFYEFWVYWPTSNDITGPAEENQFQIYTDRDYYNDLNARALLAGANTDVKITYIASDDPVLVNIPETWCRMLAVSYALRIRSFLASNMREDGNGIGFHAQLPDLRVIIQYSDIQGIQYKQEESISWDIQFDYNKTTDPDVDEDWTRSLRTDFYFDYMR